LPTKQHSLQPTKTQSIQQQQQQSIHCKQITSITILSAKNIRIDYRLAALSTQFILYT